MKEYKKYEEILWEEPKMNKDMHQFLARLEREKPWDVLRIKKEVSPEFEIPAILQQVEVRW